MDANTPIDDVATWLEYRVLDVDNGEDQEHCKTLRDAFDLPLTPEKAEIITREIWKFETRADIAREAAKKPQADAKQFDDRADLLRRGLLGLLQASNLRKIETAIGIPSRTPPKDRVEVAANVEDHILEWPDDVRAECVRTEIRVDKAKVKKLPGDVIAQLPGVSVVKGEESLTIR